MGIGRRLDFYVNGTLVGGLSFSDPLLLKSGFKVMNAAAGDGMPDMGDLVTAEGLGPGCVEVTVAGAASVVAPEAVDLNFLYPF